MKRLKLLAAGLFTCVALSTVWGQVSSGASVSWLAPTTYADTSVIAAGELDHYTISWTSTAPGGPSGSLTVPGTALAAVVPLSCGAANFAVTVTTTASAKYPNATSGPAGPVLWDSKVVCAPNPPTGLAVQSSVTSQAVKK